MRATGTAGVAALLAAGALLGAVVTGIVVRRGPPPAAAGTEHTEEETHAEHAGEGGRIVLDADARRVAGIRTAQVEVGPVGSGITVPGTVEVSPSGTARVTAPAAAKVTRILAQPGDRVRAGQPLAVLDSYEVAQAHAAEAAAASAVKLALADLQTSRAEAAHTAAGVRLSEAGLEQARDQLASAEVSMTRQRELADAGAFSQAPLQAAQSELNEAQSELLTAQTELQSHQAALQRAERLYREELISRQELEQARLEHKQDQARVDRAQARVGLSQQSLERERRVAGADLMNRQALHSADAAVRAAQGDVRKSAQEVARGQQDVRRAKRAEAAARTALEGARASLQAARTTLYALEGTAHAQGTGGLVTLRAPLDGTVTASHVTLGEAVERTTTLFVVESLRSVAVEALVPEAQLRGVRTGQTVEVTVTAHPGRRFAGVIQRVGGRLDERTRSLPVHVLVGNSAGLLRPEMFAQVHLPVGPAARAMRVPVEAVTQDGDRSTVFVEEEGGFEARAVQTGRRMDGFTEVVEGLEPGEVIAVAGVFVLKSEVRKGELKGHDH